VVLDEKGDDLYESSADGPVYSVGGIAVLVDGRGADVYRTGRHGIACSAAGFALLLDGAGDDVYEGEDFTQAYSLGGVALLLDAGGDDSYRAWAYAQGAGNGPGLAALVDAGGDDTYLADGHWPDVYGNSGPEVYHGAAQGYSAGFRDSPAMPAGLAALVDLDGRDRYQAGNFSQGGAYFFGFGLLYDGGGDDENFGTRYSQGFGVHQALGVRWDAGGDDRYHTRTVANCGSAWDEGVGYLLDDSGDDLYEAGGLSLGGAAQTAIAVLCDGGGRDQYRSSGGKDTVAGTGGSEYHDLPALGVLLDLGGAEDEYGRTGRGNDQVAAEEGAALFLDTSARDLATLLRRRGPITR
jgi:hypothetical protein